MVTKSQLSEEMNEVLGTELQFDKMPKDDLELLVELTKSGALIEPMTKYQVKEHGKDKYEEAVDEWYPGKFAKRVL